MRRLGNFETRGYATVSLFGIGGRQSKHVACEREYTSHDNIDPNSTYASDVLFALTLSFVYEPHNYQVHLSWGACLNVEMCRASVLNAKGHPFDENAE